jgi:poly(3-hydroxybutyrate) depolymerase
VSLAYQALELQRTLLQPLGAYARTVSSAWSAVPGAGPILAAAELLDGATRRYDKPAFELDSTLIDGELVRVREEIVLETPFCRLIRFSRETRQGDPRVLLVAPLSGHFATLLRETVRELLPGHDVYITDWVDARLVPASDGTFGLHDYIDLVPELIDAVGPEVHVVAVCQPCVPVLAAVATLAAADAPTQPLTMTLMNGPVDARISPTRVNAFGRDHSLPCLEATVIHGVPYGLPGAGRRVYPGALQLQAFMAMDLPRHAAAFVQHYGDVALGEGHSPRAVKHRRFYDEYFSVMDLPAEFYLETVDEVFQRFTLATGSMVHRGVPVRPSAIHKTALLTIEGALDDITGPGQTAAAHALCSSLPADMKRHHVQPSVGHYGTFSGRGWRDGVLPVLRDFIKSHA